MDGPRETEVKLRVAELSSVRSRLLAAGASLLRERQLEDNTLLDDPQGSLRARGCVLRVRRSGQRSEVTFKGPRQDDGGLKSREELETAVGDPAVLLEVLGRLGLRPCFRYQKYRESWRYRGQTIELDETPIGCFVEIEGEAAGIHAAATDLGFGRDDYLADSYVSLFFAAGGRGDMVFGPEAAR